jgi:hypothetical protein
VCTRLTVNSGDFRTLGTKTIPRSFGLRTCLSFSDPWGAKVEPLPNNYSVFGQEHSLPFTNVGPSFLAAVPGNKDER